MGTGSSGHVAKVERRLGAAAAGPHLVRAADRVRSVGEVGDSAMLDVPFWPRWKIEIVMGLSFMSANAPQLTSPSTVSAFWPISHSRIALYWLNIQFRIVSIAEIPLGATRDGSLGAGQRRRFGRAPTWGTGLDKFWNSTWGRLTVFARGRDGDRRLEKTWPLLRAGGP